MSFSSKAFREIDEIVSSWTEKYQHHISMIQNKPRCAKFMVQFSLPKPAKPVPVGTVRVYFTALIDQDQKELLSFRFEKDSLIHTVEQTIRHKQIEKWIDSALEKKLLVRETVFYLGTSYEQTRVKDPRKDKILEEKVVVEQLEYVYIDPDILADQQRSIQIMQNQVVDRKAIEKNVIGSFKVFDKENIGVITYPELIGIFKNLGIKLSPEETKEVLLRVDKSQTGTVQFANYKQIVTEILEGMEAKKSADLMLQAKREEETFGSILTLINDQSQDIEDDLINRFKSKDQDQTGFTNYSQVKLAFEEINKKAKAANKNQPLGAIQMAEITKILTQLYGYKEIPYNKVHKHIIDYKINALSEGRVHSQMNFLETYLREIFDKYDEKKFGKITMTNLIKALTECQKIKLTKSQTYLLKNILPTDQKGNVNYIQTSKFMSQIIKKFYIFSDKKKQ